MNPSQTTTVADVKEAETAARILGVRLEILKAGTPNEIEAAFAVLVGQHINALTIQTDSFLFDQRIQIIGLAAHHAVPTIYPERENVVAGGLMSYGSYLSDSLRLAGSYAGRILKGEKPADLPVQQSTRIEMVLSLKTAKALGIDPVPTATLLRATEVIE